MKNITSWYFLLYSLFKLSLILCFSDVYILVQLWSVKGIMERFLEDKTGAYDNKCVIFSPGV